MYSNHNAGKSAIAENFIRALKTKIYKQMTSNTYIDKLDDIVNKYNNTSHRTIKEKPANIKLPSMYFDLSKQNNKDIPKFKVIVHVRISTYTICFYKRRPTIWV